jgi:hypothetical protein
MRQRRLCLTLHARRLEDNMTREEIETCWRDPRNRKWGFLYYCKADPRVIVPKHPKWMGWTANFAHPSAIAITLLLITLVAAPVWTVISMGAGTALVFATVIAAIFVLCLLCAYLSSRTK